MNHATTSSQQRPVARRFPPAVPAVAALLALLASSVRVAADDGGLRDCVLTARARQALAQDRALAPLNLGVSVRSGAATLWGQVPAAGLSRRAEDKIRKLPGIREVRNELRVEATADPVAEFLRSATVAAQRPALESFLSPSPPPPTYLTRRWVEEPGQPPPTGGSGIVLLAPVIGSQPLANGGQDDLAAVVDRLRRSDPRFERLHAEVTGRLVRLSGIVGRDGDAMELAQTLSRIHGVERVVIGDVRIEIDLPGRQ